MNPYFYQSQKYVLSTHASFFNYHEKIYKKNDMRFEYSCLSLGSGLLKICLHLWHIPKSVTLIVAGQARWLSVNYRDACVKLSGNIEVSKFCSLLFLRPVPYL